MNISYLQSRFNEIFIVEPNDLGHPLITKLYKSITGHLKTMPFLYVIPFSIILSAGLYFVSSFVVVRLTTLLQNAF